jgi:hypothetical protein
MTKMTQGPWTRIRPLQIDEVDAKTAAAIKTGELTRGWHPQQSRQGDGLLPSLRAAGGRVRQLLYVLIQSLSSVTFRPPASTTGSSRNWSSREHRC